MLKVSRQKIYDSLILIKKHYKTFDHLVIFVSYTPYQGLRLNVRFEQCAKRSSWIKNTIEVTDCLQKKTFFDIADSIGDETEIWIRNNHLS